MEVSCVVLTLAVHMICRLGENDCAMLPCALAVRKSVYDAHLGDVRTLGHNVALGNREASFAGAHLDAVVSDPQPYRKSKRCRKPFSGDRRVRINEDGNHSARRDGAIGEHTTI